MDDIKREMEVRRRITSIYRKTRDAFDNKDAYDSYLETVEDIIYKLSYDIDVAEVEQQVSDYIRQEEALAGASTKASASTYAPVSTGSRQLPTAADPCEMDQQGTLIISSSAPLSRQQWQAMADASGWSSDIATCRSMQDAFASIFITVSS